MARKSRRFWPVSSSGDISPRVAYTCTPFAPSFAAVASASGMGLRKESAMMPMGK